jgi:exopolysaccharide biosynthesis polyprenyl glycosylphosphotransferase
MQYGPNEFARSSSAELPVEPHPRLASEGPHVAEPAPTVYSDSARSERKRALRREGLLRWCRCAACVFVPVLVVLVPGHKSLATVTLALAVATIWLIAIDLANSSMWFSPLALGTRVISTMGVLAAVPAVILVDGLFPADTTSSVELALATAMVAASAIAFWELASGKPKVRRVVIVGLEGGGAALADELQSDPALPFRCLGFVVEANGDGQASSNGHRPANALGTIAELSRIVRVHRPDLVVFAGGGRNEAMANLLNACPSNLRVLSLPDFYEHAFGRVPVEHVSATWFMSVLHLYRRPYPRLVRTLFDVVVAGFALLLTLPLLPLIALLVRWSGPGPILFRQTRVGEAGRPFEILKFRTMVEDAERPGEPIWAASGDKRVTRVGRHLRRTRLDELPQLWNVLRGDMSMVGPRPERPEFITPLEQAVPHWTRRNLVKPGITGWAQIRVGYTSDPVTALDKLSYDLYYIKHRTLLLDLAIVAKTGAILVSGSGAK